MKRILKSALLLSLIIALVLGACSCDILSSIFGGGEAPPISLDEIPEFCGDPYVKINGNKPFFTEDEITDKSYEKYGELDGLGRCTAAIACLGIDLMPTED